MKPSFRSWAEIATPAKRSRERKDEREEVPANREEKEEIEKDFLRDAVAILLWDFYFK